MHFSPLGGYGWYSNRMRGDRKKQEERGKGESEDLYVSDDRVIGMRAYKPRQIPQLIWRECIKKVWKVNLLLAPNMLKIRYCSLR